MPIIPGLAGAPADDGGEGGAPAGIEELLAAIPDDELQRLEEAAKAAADAGTLDAWLAEDPAAEAASAGGEGDEQQETPEEEMAESDEEQEREEDEGEEDPTPHVRAAEDAAKAAARACDELTRLVDDAKEHEEAGVDVDALEELLEDAEEAAKDAQDAQDEASSAGDAEGAAEAAKDAQEAQAAAEKALADAKASVAKDADGAEEAAVPDEVKAMTAWARKVSGLA